MVEYLTEVDKRKLLATNSMGYTALDILDKNPRDLTTHDEIKRILYSFCSTDQELLETLPKISDLVMVVVVLIATMAFEATVSPPGWVWQEDTSAHSAGKAVMASTHPTMYKHFSRANTTAFISSLLTIFLVTTGQTMENFFVAGFATSAMWVALASIGVSYGASLIMTNPMVTQSIGRVVAIVVSLCMGIFGSI